MSDISNYQVYLNGMRKSLADKLFFIKFCKDFDTIVDFGCANGQLLKSIYEIRPQVRLFGIENNPVMVNMINDKVDIISVYQSLQGIKHYIQDCNIPDDYNHVLLNIGSVIHEIYSYQSKEYVDNFWEDVFDGSYKYICIRDMMVSRKDIDSLVPEKIMNSMYKYGDKDQIDDFVEKNGNIITMKDLTEFLLKYRYIDNWSREVVENYLPITVEDLLNIIPSDKYRFVYFDHYILPFIQDQIFIDFKIQFDVKTHVKIILERID